jgi:hypothetical protein
MAIQEKTLHLAILLIEPEDFSESFQGELVPKFRSAVLVRE